MHIGGRGREGYVKKFGHKNAIKHEKGDHLDFLTTQSTRLKRIWPQPKRPPPPLDFQSLCIYALKCFLKIGFLKIVFF
jgi:hypothetical protein